MTDSLGSDVDELLYNDFNFSRALRISCLNDSGVVVCGEGSLPKSHGGSRMEITAFQKPQTSTFPFVLDKLSLNKDGRVGCNVSISISDETKLFISGEDERQDPGKPLNSFGKIGATYDSGGIKIDNNVDIVNGPTACSSFYYAPTSSPWNFAADFQVNTRWDEKGANNSTDGGITGRHTGLEWENINFGFQFNGPSWCVAAKTKERLSILSLGYFQSLSPTFSYGTMVNYSINHNTQDLALGIRKKMDQNTSVKFKITSAADISGVLKHSLTPQLMLGICSEMNLNQNIAANQKFGICLTFDNDFN
jgi:hypothetical protein